MKTQYDKLKKRIEDAFEAVDEALNRPDDDLVGLGKHFVRVRELAEMAKGLREVLYKAEDMLSQRAIPEAMRDKGVKTITIEGVGRLSISHRYSCSMIDKEAAIQWLRDSGEEGLIKETVNSSSLGAFARNKIEEEGVELPPDLFKTSISAFTSLTKAK